MAKFFFFLFLVCTNLFIHAQEKEDTLLLPFEVLQFKSTFENQVFEQLTLDTPVDLLSLFVAIDYTKNDKDYALIKSKLTEFVGLQRQSGIETKKPAKQIKILYGTVHKEYFDKYEFKNSFPQIFVDGSYNCVSASALFAFVFGELSIPYQIMEFPNHVMLTAYPGASQITVETTDPATGFISFSPKMKKEYAQYLRANKLISEAEYAEGDEIVFQKNYYKSKSINLKQLAGIQYHNMALYALDDEHLSIAMDFATKAHFLYPCLLTKNTVIITAGKAAEKLTLPDSTRLRAYKLLTFFINHGVEATTLIEHFANYSDKMLKGKTDLDGLKHIYEVFYAPNAGEKYLQSLELIHNYQIARYFVLKKNYTDALPYAIKAYQIDSNDMDVRTLTSTAIISHLELQNNNEGISFAEHLLDSLPELRQITEIYSWLGNAYLLEFGRAFQTAETRHAEINRKKFEVFMVGRSMIQYSINRHLFESAYNEAAVYYFRKGAYAKVNEVLMAAQSIDPANATIQKLQQRYR